MKFINFQAFAELAELTARANGKTTETIRFALNFLFDGMNRQVLYIGLNQASCDYARKLAVEFVNAHPEYQIEIRRNNRHAIEFLSGRGHTVLVFSPHSTAIYACRGRTLDEIIFDVDPETLFKGSQKENGKFKELFYSVFPCMAHRPKVDCSSLPQYF